MIFRQMFDAGSGTYSYFLASRRGGEALVIDPVLEKVGRYIELLNELDLRLVKAIDTHLHADHIRGLGALRERTQCITVMGEQSKAEIVPCRSMMAKDRGRRIYPRRNPYTGAHGRFLFLRNEQIGSSPAIRC